MGTEYGGYLFPKIELGPDPTYYGFGCGEDISFDLSLAAKYPGLRMRLFDPTPRAVSHVKAVFASMETRKAPAFASSHKV